MANSLFDAGREAFLTGNIDWASDDIRLVFVDSSDTPDVTTAEFLADIDELSRVAVSDSFAAKTVTGGSADADDVTLAEVTGAEFGSIVIYQHTGDESTSRLIAFIDSASGLPLTPSGSDITVKWDDGASKIFRL